MSFHEMIDKEDVTSIRSYITPDNVHTRNRDGETLIVYMIKHYQNKWQFTLSSLILQHLLNMGADKSPVMAYVQECVDTIGFDPSTKKFFLHVLKASSTVGPNQSQSSIRRPSAQHRERASAVGNKRSQYSAQEKLQLDKIAQRLGIPLQDNHLALKIITHILRHNICIGCQSNSTICKECLKPQQN